MALRCISESRNFSRLLVFSILLLGYCSRCHMTVVRSHELGSTTPLSSTNCTSLDSRRTRGTAVAEGNTRSALTERPVVVFDVDWTISSAQDHIATTFGNRGRAVELAECPRIWFTDVEYEEPYLYIFLPHLRILFDYLMEHGVRIVFFSGEVKERNLLVIPDLLRSFWGSGKYEALRSKGQFRIHSKDDLTPDEKSWNMKKDLRPILQNGESLSNAVLVDDAIGYCAVGQETFILAPMFYFGGLLKGEYDPLNNVYYFLGLFKTYFENEKYKELPLRDAVKRIIPTNHTDSCCNIADERKRPPFADDFHGKHPFVQEMVDIGFAAVREEVPNATMYVN